MLQSSTIVSARTQTMPRAVCEFMVRSQNPEFERLFGERVYGLLAWLKENKGWISPEQLQCLSFMEMLFHHKLLPTSLAILESMLHSDAHIFTSHWQDFFKMIAKLTSNCIAPVCAVAMQMLNIIHCLRSNIAHHEMLAVEEKSDAPPTKKSKKAQTQLQDITGQNSQFVKETKWLRANINIHLVKIRACSLLELQALEFIFGIFLSRKLLQREQHLHCFFHAELLFRLLSNPAQALKLQPVLQCVCQKGLFDADNPEVNVTIGSVVRVFFTLVQSMPEQLILIIDLLDILEKNHVLGTGQFKNLCLIHQLLSAIFKLCNPNEFFPTLIVFLTTLSESHVLNLEIFQLLVIDLSKVSSWNYVCVFLKAHVGQIDPQAVHNFISMSHEQLQACVAFISMASHCLLFFVEQELPISPVVGVFFQNLLKNPQNFLQIEGWFKNIMAFFALTCLRESQRMHRQALYQWLRNDPTAVVKLLTVNTQFLSLEVEFFFHMPMQAVVQMRVCNYLASLFYLKKGKFNPVLLSTLVFHFQQLALHLTAEETERFQEYLEMLFRMLREHELFIDDKFLNFALQDTHSKKICHLKILASIDDALTTIRADANLSSWLFGHTVLVNNAVQFIPASSEGVMYRHLIRDHILQIEKLLPFLVMLCPHADNATDKVPNYLAQVRERMSGELQRPNLDLFPVRMHCQCMLIYLLAHQEITSTQKHAVFEKCKGIVGYRCLGNLLKQIFIYRETFFKRSTAGALTTTQNVLSGTQFQTAMNAFFTWVIPRNELFYADYFAWFCFCMEPGFQAGFFRSQDFQQFEKIMKLIQDLSLSPGKCLTRILLGNFGAANLYSMRLPQLKQVLQQTGPLRPRAQTPPEAAPVTDLFATAMVPPLVAVALPPVSEDADMDPGIFLI